MSKINGHSKGAEYERNIAKQLSIWLSKGERDDLFWRTHGSGSRHTTRVKKNIRTEGQDGDISSTCRGISDKFRRFFSIEIKFYKNINLWGLITGKKTGILSFWNEAVVQADSVYKEPVLIAKENYKPALFISTAYVYGLFHDYFGLNYDMKVNVLDNTLFVWKLEDILKIETESIEKMLDRHLGEESDTHV